MPTVSVIMPAYNAAATLPRALDSLLAQTYTDWEAVLVNDGSTDATAEIAGEYAARDSRIRLIHQENAGVSAARNRAIENAAGRYLAFLDTDDWMASEMLAVLTDAAARSGAQAAVCGYTMDWADGRSVPCRLPLPTGVLDAAACRESIACRLLDGRLAAEPLNGFVWLYLLDAQLVKERGICFSGAYLEDELFLIDYFAQAESLCITDTPLYHYFQTDASVTHRYMADFAHTFFRSLERKKALAEQHNLHPDSTWEETTLWAGLLIAIGNLFAPGSPGNAAEKCRRLKQLCKQEDFARAVAAYTPTTLGRNKAVVAGFVKRRLYWPLTWLYLLKNRGRNP